MAYFVQRAILTPMTWVEDVAPSHSPRRGRNCTSMVCHVSKRQMRKPRALPAPPSEPQCAIVTQTTSPHNFFLDNRNRPIEKIESLTVLEIRNRDLHPFLKRCKGVDSYDVYLQSPTHASESKF